MISLNNLFFNKILAYKTAVFYAKRPIMTTDSNMQLHRVNKETFTYDTIQMKK